ncbi:MAG TPA: NAD(P)/FAD-dependent oxidoreductase [Pseudonocardia sp.]|jgi:cation diffusion facilitator CzcD-associated flavoprotein CzcO|nr:NAD(P)/FAD-dependent oxidoreductase [Pseudonocardia sp.]
MDQVRLGCELLAAQWDDTRGRWELETSTGPIHATVLISAVGPFGDPVVPPLPGKDRFLGTATHTFGWQAGPQDIQGRRVAVIGTGASVQVIPAIQPDAGKVLVFQRTPCWIMPRFNPRSGWAGRILRRLSPVRAIEQAVQYALYESYGTFNFIDPRFAGAFEAVARMQLRRQVPDPGLRAELTPDYRIGCKRAAVSSNYLPAFSKPNVALVTEGRAEITEHGIRTDDGRQHEVDTIVWATGFSMVNSTARRIVGRNDSSLADVYEQRPQSYLGVSVAGFPNLFLTSGTFGGAGNQSFLYMLESQFAYIVDALRTMREKNIAVVDVTEDAQEKFVQEAEKRSAATIWLTGGCNGYYTTPDGTRNAGLWPDWSFNYRRRLTHFHHAAYEVRTADVTVPSTAPEV